MDICPLCDREMDEDDADKHHLVPKQKGGKKGDVTIIHVFCHTKIHSLFTNAELKKQFSTIEKLREHPEIMKFIAWVADKPSSFYMKNTQRKERRR